MYNDKHLISLYNRFARSLDSPEAPMNRWLDRNLETGRRALDIGCGTGRYSLMLADRYDEVVAVDLAPSMIEIAERDRSRPNISYQVRDVLSMTPERDGVFDLVLALGCVINVGPPEVVLDHFRRLTAKNGLLLIMESMWEPGWGTREWQVNFAFRTARSVWDSTGDLDDVSAVLQVILNPTWLEIAAIDVPLEREAFIHEYTAALPGATIEEECKRLGLGVFAVSWRAVERE
ncbi:MAG TPA: class I SAM-dependent methyltransferase [Pseudonocardiaceae bacterium]